MKRGGQDPVMKRSGQDPVIKRGGQDPVIKRGGQDPFIKRCGQDPVIKRGGQDPVNRFNYSTFLYLSQATPRITIGICCGLFVFNDLRSGVSNHFVVIEEL